MIIPKKRFQIANLSKQNSSAAQDLWGTKLTPLQLEQLNVIGETFSFSITSGDLILIDHRWYVTHTGLLRLATRKRCSGIHVRAVTEFCDVENCRWAFEATVYKSRTCRGFVGFGDADISNTSSVVRGAEMRVAETRAVNRALRKAYGIGICSVEEIGCAPRPEPPAQVVQIASAQNPSNGNGNSNRNGSLYPVRDQIYFLIQKHKLDATLVKLYAAAYCGTKELREASREQMQEFAKHLADYADRDREALLCELNSRARKQEEAA